MGFLRNLINGVANNSVTKTLNKLDPAADNVTDTVQRAVNAGWGKPLGRSMSGLDVLGAGPLAQRGVGADPNKPGDRRVGRAVGSFFAGEGIGAAAGAGADATAAGATSADGINIGAGSVTDTAGGTFGTGTAVTTTSTGLFGTSITAGDVVNGLEAVSAVASLANAMKGPQQRGGGDPGPTPIEPDPLQPAVDPDLAAIRKRNAMLFGIDTASSTDLTKGGADMGNLGRVTLLGGSSRLGA